MKVNKLPWLRRSTRGLPRFCAVLALLSLHAPLASCQSRSAKSAVAPGPKPVPKSSMLSAVQTDKFNLSAAPGTADGYPVTIDQGRFFAATGGGFPIPSGHIIEEGWGGTAIGWAVGDPMQPAPDGLEIRWYSYAEDAFWQGKFLLPQERIHALLKQGLWDAEQKKQITYNDLAVSVLPTGGVVVWLRGRNRVFIGRYQAQRIDYDYALHRPRVDRAAVLATRRAQMSPEVQQEIKTGTLSAKKWDEYLRRYRWQLEFSQPMTLANFGLTLLSAERLSLAPTPDFAAYTRELLLTPTEKAVPKSTMLYLSGAYGRKRLLKVSPFDEAETQAAFRTLYAQFPAEPLKLHVELNQDLTTAALSLRAGGKSVPLTKSKVQFFDY